MNKKLRRNESGVALLFALGLLALMILLCVSFSMESLQSQKAASNNSYRSAAKALGMSAVNHAALVILQYQNQQWDQAGKNYNIKKGVYTVADKTGTANQTLGLPVDFSAIVSRSDSDSSVPDNVRNDRLGTLLPLRSVYAGGEHGSLKPYILWYSSINISDSKRNPHWIYVREGNSSDDPIVGRFAYRVLPPASSTRINLAYFLRGEQKLSTSPSGLISELSQLDLKKLPETELDSNSEISKINKAINESLEKFKDDLTEMSKNVGNYGETKNPLPIVGSFQLVSGANKSRFYDGNGVIDSEKYDAVQRIFSDGVLPGDIEAFKLEHGKKVWYLHRYNLRQSVNVNGVTDKVSALIKDTRDGKKDNTVITPFLLDKLAKESVGKDKEAVYDKRYLTAQNNYMTPFFFGMISNNAASFSDIQSRKSQIAANFLDYCDADSDPTSDSDNWTTTPPSYTGNEKTFYINELAYGIKVTAEKSGKKVNLSFSPTMFAELVDIYGGLSASGYSLTGGISSISFTVSGTVTQIQKTGDSTSRTSADYTVSSTEKSAAWTADMTISNFAGSRYAAGYQTGATVSMTDGLEFTGIPEGYEIAEFKVTINNLKINFNERLHLTSGTANADYSRLPGDAMNVSNSEIELTDAALNKYWLIGNMSVKDPRQNLNAKSSNKTANSTGDNWKLNDWVFDPKVMNTDGTPNVSSLGSANGELSMKIGIDQTLMTPESVDGYVNAYSNPAKPRMTSSGLAAVDITDANSIDSDIENVDDPAATGETRISTAYIANKPMESFWELGMIHRGAAWETINLGKNSTTPESIFSYITSGNVGFAGSSYKDGDAYILDMVKLTPSAVSYGLFDINMLRANYPGFDYAGANTDCNIFAEIFANLKKHNDPTSFVGGTDDVDAAGFAAAVIKKANDEVNEFLSRSDIAEHFTSVFNEKNNNNLTDARREEIIAKVMPLLKAEPALVTVFHIDIVAQTINDVGGFKVSKLDNDGKLVESESETKIGTLDYDSEKNIYFDDITGQVKMRATFDCNPFTGRIKLRQIRYLD